MGICCSSYLEWEKEQERYDIQQRVNSQPIDEINYESVYVIGNNIHGELTIKLPKIPHLLNFTMLNREYITNIQSGHYCTFYSDKHHKNMFVSGNNQSFTNINDHPSIFNYSLDAITWFNDHALKIKKICTNHVSLSTFWITTTNEIYANGINHNGELGLNDHRKRIWPCLIPELSKNIHVIDIISNPRYSLALCGTNKNVIISLLSYWYNQDRIENNDNNEYNEYKHIHHKNHRKNTIKNDLMTFNINDKICTDIVNLILKFYEINSIYSTSGFDDGEKWHNGKWRKIKMFKDRHILKIKTGLKHSLILEDNGSIWTFGSNTFGELGIGDNTEYEEIDNPMEIPYFIQNKVCIIDIRCGSEHNLAISQDYKVYSWGLNASRQCGIDKQISFVYKPVMIKKLEEYEVNGIEAGHRHSYCKSVCGKHWLFGSNEYNECITYDGRKKVKEPFQIDQIIKEYCKGKYVKSVSLGYYNTKIIVRRHKDQYRFGEVRGRSNGGDGDKQETVTTGDHGHEKQPFLT